ncbi:hypothetical protein Ahy_B03g065410 [Arachis hypogaea]|uniref:Transposase MuDR plant domain-containing protein n=1 Tax=Arachis hypogaea TaxID=3818 RepID=A0A445A1N9_ARAHY|nr:hypothetical protein Ahy_B03g065410 [Arachis hypogaea]
MFDVHARLIPQHMMEWYAVVRDMVVGGGPSPSSPEVVPLDATPIYYTQPRDNADSEGDSTYVTESRSSSDTSSSEEYVTETPTGSGARFLLPPPFPIPRLSEVPNHYHTLNLDAMQPDDPFNAGKGDYYNMDGGVEFRVGHRFSNRDTVLMAVKNYSIRRNAEYRVLESDRLKYHWRYVDSVEHSE